MQSYACHVNRQRVVVVVVMVAGWLAGCCRCFLALSPSRSSSIWWMVLVFQRRCHHCVDTLHFSYFAFRSSVDLTKFASSLCMCTLHCTMYNVHILLFLYIRSYNENIRANVYECEYVFCLFTPPIFFRAQMYYILFAFWPGKSRVFSLWESSSAHEHTSSMLDSLKYFGMKG